MTISTVGSQPSVDWERGPAQPPSYLLMFERFNRREFAILGLSIIGALISTYLTYVYYSGANAICTGAGGCETVQSSQFAVVAGVSVALLGLALYVLLAGLTLAPILVANEWISLSRFGLALAGVLYSTYLTYLELFVIHAICPWCVTSAVIMVGILAMAWLGPSKSPA